jgi:hypothetical protein
MGLASLVVGKRVEYRKRRRAGLQSEPDQRALLLIRQSQRVPEELRYDGLFPCLPAIAPIIRL